MRGYCLKDMLNRNRQMSGAFSELKRQCVLVSVS